MKHELILTTSWEVVSSIDEGVLSFYLNSRNRDGSQVTIDDNILTGVEDILQEAVIRAEAGVRAKLAENGIDASSVCGLEDVLTELKIPFNGLETEFKQEKYFKTSLNMLVSLMYYAIKLSL